VEVEDRFSGERRTIACAATVDCGFRLPDEPIEGAAIRAGDCVAPRTVHEAILEGRRTAVELEQLTERPPLEISGSVLYRQRIALPPGAELTVRLSDVSLADAPAVTLAEQVIPVEHQVPIPFTLHVDRAALDERHTYALSARITIDGELRWISDTHIPVRLPGPTTGIDVLVVPVG
jgi:putative lipoprotein